MIVVIFLMMMVLPKYQAYINLTTIITALFFLLIGYIYDEKREEKHKVLALAFTFIITVVIATINDVGMPDYQDGDRILFVLGAITGTKFILTVSKLFFSKMLDTYGKNSLVILGTHYPIIKMVKWKLKKADFERVEGILFLITLIVIEGLFIIGITKCSYFVKNVLDYSQASRHN